MAAAALLRSVASKIARAPQTHHRPLLARGFHGGARSGNSLPSPPTSNEDFRTTFAKATTGVVYVTLFGSVIYVCGRLVHVLYKLGDKLEARSRERLKVNGILTETVEAIEHILSEDLSTTTISEDQSMQSLGHGKQPGKERVSGLEEAHGHLELEAAVNILQAEIDELKNLTAEISKRRIELESARSEAVKRN
ncbi:unnamed protein product [Urochloa humidicola]